MTWMAATPRLLPLLRGLRGPPLWAPPFRPPLPHSLFPATRSFCSPGAQAASLPPQPPEPRLEELGLGAYTPVGFIQNLLEYLHLDLGLPWWGAIVAGTVGARLSLLPLLLRAQREAARLSLHLPQLQRLAQRLAEARRRDDRLAAARAHAELSAYQQRHQVNPLRGFLVPLLQTPVFVSFFLALQGLAAAPAPGLQRGGLGWFPDLTAPDPLCALPLLVTGTACLVVELGAETGVASPGSAHALTRLVLRFLPLLFLPFVIHFPAAVLTYWLTSNSFSLVQTGLLRLPALRRRLRIPAPPPPPPPSTDTDTPSQGKKGVLGALRKEWAEARATQRAEERRWRERHRLDLAAKGPLRQTFAQNPLAAPPPPPLPSPPPPPQAPPAPERPWKDTLG